MGRPVHADGRQTRQAILDAALDLFAERGYFGTSLRDIASVVGVRESAFYNYFDSKEDLFTQLLAAASQSKDQQWARFLAEPHTDVHAMLARLTGLVLEYFCERRQERMFLISMSDGMRLAKQGRLDLIDRLTNVAKPFQVLMQRLIDEGDVRQANPEVLAMEFLGPLVLWRKLRALGTRSPIIEDRAAFARDHVEQFLRGAGARNAPKRRSVKQSVVRGSAAAARRTRRGALKLVR